MIGAGRGGIAAQLIGPSSFGLRFLIFGQRQTQPVSMQLIRNTAILSLGQGISPSHFLKVEDNPPMDTHQTWLEIVIQDGGYLLQRLQDSTVEVEDIQLQMLLYQAWFKMVCTHLDPRQTEAFSAFSPTSSGSGSAPERRELAKSLKRPRKGPRYWTPWDVQSDRSATGKRESRWSHNWRTVMAGEQKNRERQPNYTVMNT